MEPLTSSFWANEAALLYAVVFDVVEEAARRGVLNAAQGIIQQLLRIGLPEPDYDLLNESAYRYAERHTFELVSGITDTSKRALQREFAEWIESGEPLPKLVERIKPLYGPVRANMIAVTEITRAYADSNIMAWRELGVDAQKWQTTVDEDVCEICAPKHGQEYQLGDPDGTPPGHVNCRCWIQPVIRVPEWVNQ